MIYNSAHFRTTNGCHDIERFTAIPTTSRHSFSPMTKALLGGRTRSCADASYHASVGPHRL